MTAALATTPTTSPEADDLPLPNHVWHYPATPHVASLARRDVTAQLRHWGLDELIDTAEVVTSELTTNALAAYQHAQPRHTDSAASSRVAVRLAYTHHDLIVEVWDKAPGRPARRYAGPDAEHGRGLNLVAALTSKTGYYEVRVRTTDHGYRTNGKVVWAVLPHGRPPVPHLTETPAEDMPRRAPSSTLDQHAPVLDVDLEVLQRVIDRLRTLDDWTRDVVPLRSRPSTDRTRGTPVADVDRPCPTWCEQPAGHLDVHPAGPGDYHVSEFTVIDLPQIPGIRDETAVQVSVEQYVTTATTYEPMVSLGLRADDPDSEALTLDEATALAAALTRAVTAARDTRPRPPRDGDAAA